MIENVIKVFENRQNSISVFFYCSRNIVKSARSSLDAIVTIIARQLSSLQSRHSLFFSTMAVYKKRKLEEFVSKSLNINESRLLIFQFVEYYSLTIIVIDALDECDSKRRTNFLKILKSILQKFSNLLKIFVSSRNDQDIVLHLRNYFNFELSFEINKNDISSFVIVEIDNLMKKKNLLILNINKKKLKIEITEQVTKKIDEMSILFNNASHVYVSLM